MLTKWMFCGAAVVVCCLIGLFLYNADSGTKPETNAAVPSEAAASTPHDALFSEYNKANEALKTELLTHMSEEEVADRFVLVAPLHRLANFGPKFLALAQQSPDSDLGWRCYRQVAYIGGFDTADKEVAMTMLVKHHSARDEFYADLYFHLTRPGMDAERFYRLILEAKEEVPAKVVGRTKYCLASLLAKKQDDKDLQTKRRAESLSLLDDVAMNHERLEHPWKADESTLGEAANSLAFELRFLVDGAVAPNLSGLDVLDNPIELSSFRGSIVIVIFCGEWCAPCVELKPLLVKLLNEHQDDVQLIEINSDTREVLASRKSMGIDNWNTIWDGGSTNGPIGVKWNIGDFPTVFVIGKDGKIVARLPQSSTPDRILNLNHIISEILAFQDS